MSTPVRYCKRGHDKWAPHGAYIRLKKKLTKKFGWRVFVYHACAVCNRLRHVAYRQGSAL